MKHLWRTRVLIASAVLVALAGLLPSLLAQSQLQLGNQTYSRAAAPPLRMPVTRSARFFRGVGGVAFSAVAQGQGGQVVDALRYDSTAADGQRLQVTVRSKDGSTHTARGGLYDWQLVPTAEFALDENGSAVTLFGQLDDEQQHLLTLASGGRVINYHPKLQDTLLGLRLFQADILIIQPNAADLFARDGKIILGAGEGAHDYARNMERFEQITAWQESQARLGLQYQSYVVGDLDAQVTFTVAKGVLTFTGSPSWTAWRRRFRAPEDIAKVEALEERLEPKIDTYNTLLGSMQAGQTPEASATPRLTQLRAEIAAIEKQLEHLNAVEQMPEYSRALSQRIAELNGINPVVFRSVKAVMHYRALFKHFERQNPQGFAAFVKSLNGVRVAPAVTTPTIQSAPEPSA